MPDLERDKVGEGYTGTNAASPLDNLGRLFPGQEAALSEAKSILRQVVDREADETVLDTFLSSDPGRDSLLTTPHRELRNKSPLTVLRAQVELERLQMERMIREPKAEAQSFQPSSVEVVDLSTVADEKIPGQSAEEYSKSQVRWDKGKLKPTVTADRTIYNRRIPPPIEQEDDLSIEMVRSSEDVGAKADTATLVYLFKQGVVNSRTIAQVIDAYPNLETIQLPPSFARLLSPRIRASIEEKGINLRIARLIRELDHYDRAPSTSRHSEGKQLYEAAIQDPLRQHDLALLKEFDEATWTVASLYYGPRRISVRQIADTLGFTHDYSAKLLTIFNAWIGLQYGQKGKFADPNHLHRRLLSFRALASYGSNTEELRKQFRVGEHLPPTTLPIPRMEMWQKIMQLKQADPDFLVRLTDREREVLTLIFQFTASSSTPSTYDEIGEKLGGLSRGGVWSAKNRALTKLGLFDE